MKTIYKLLYASVFGILLLGSCKKEKFKDVIYLTGTEVSPLSMLSAEDGTISSVGVSITSSDLASTDITASLQTDPGLIATYNRLNGKNYLPVPEGDYDLSGSSVTIKAGTNVSDAISFRVKSTKGFKPGSAYMMPITITSANSDRKVLEASRTIYYVVKPVIVQAVASLRNIYFKPSFTDANAAAYTNLSAVTMEGKVFVNKFAASSPFISSFMGIEEHFLLRFGDVTIRPNQIQRAGGIALTAPQEFATGTWYHVAVVHDVSTTKLYVNGVLAATTSDSNNINLLQSLGAGAYGTGFLIGSSANGRYLDGMVSECRLWSKALSPTEIMDGMCGVDPASNGLIAYWKFNEGSGNVAKDVTGHGHDATASGNVTWVPDVRCK